MTEFLVSFISFFALVDEISSRGRKFFKNFLVRKLLPFTFPSFRIVPYVLNIRASIILASCEQIRMMYCFAQIIRHKIMQNRSFPQISLRCRDKVSDFVRRFPPTDMLAPCVFPFDAIVNEDCSRSLRSRKRRFPNKVSVSLPQKKKNSKVIFVDYTNLLR